MGMITVVGPLKTEDEAKNTRDALGASNHGVYSMAIKDDEGYDTGERKWFVERDTAATPQTILGYEWSEIQAMQQRRARA